MIVNLIFARMNNIHVVVRCRVLVQEIHPVGLMSQQNIEDVTLEFPVRAVG